MIYCKKLMQKGVEQEKFNIIVLLNNCCLFCVKTCCVNSRVCCIFLSGVLCVLGLDHLLHKSD